MEKVMLRRGQGMEGKDVWGLEDAPRGNGDAPRGQYGRGGPFVKNILNASSSDS